MAREKIKEPIYDERVNATIKGLIEGKSREELAEGFGLGSWKSLDIYMRRKGFSWDGDSNTYNPTVAKTEKILDEVASRIPVKAEQILKKFQLHGKDADPRTIARDMGFDDHRQMAEYMERKGLTWDSETGNYKEKFLKTNINEEETHSTEKNSRKDSGEKSAIGALDSSRTSASTVSSDHIELHLEECNEINSKIHQYLPLLKLLSENRDRLLELLMPEAKGYLPKYAVPGVPKTKSIYMSDLLARLVSEFSVAKNLSQREVVEASLIEYLRRYGYNLEVEKLLGKR